eukprot:6175255-Pleurochrysis_carterae.AAC.3
MSRCNNIEVTMSDIRWREMCLHENVADCERLKRLTAHQVESADIPSGINSSHQKKPAPNSFQSLDHKSISKSRPTSFQKVPPQHRRTPVRVVTYPISGLQRGTRKQLRSSALCV